jgi:(1->4)-alpha-D-glucan 1-alpha-D-glucosylmutase
VALDDGEAPTRLDEYLIYQAMVGAWPATMLEDGPDVGSMMEFAARMGAYVIKAVREAKRMSSWTNPNPDYEKALGGFIASALDAARPNPFIDAALPFVRRIAALGAINSLAQLTLKLCAPGVPDIYQGTEFWDLSLVDPDNRRAVDYDARRGALAANGAGGDVLRLLAEWQSGHVKLHMMHSLLRCRRENPLLFDRGGYLPIAAEGEEEGRVVAFVRHHEDASIVVAAPRLVASLPDAGPAWPLGWTWGEGVLRLPGEIGQRRFRNLFTQDRIDATVCQGGPQLRLSDIFAHLPVAVLHSR